MLGRSWFNHDCCASRDISLGVTRCKNYDLVVILVAGEAEGTAVDGERCGKEEASAGPVRRVAGAEEHA